MAKQFPHKKSIIEAILRVEPTIKKIFLFGSRARRDTKNPYSDIDIGVEAEKRLTFLHLARIEEALEELDTLYSIDVVDFTKRKDTFSEEAKKSTEVVYEKR